MHLDGYAFDICTPKAGRVTASGDACQLPADYSGTPVYDCISYDATKVEYSDSPPTKPWCFTNTQTGATGDCKPLTCSQGVQRACPAGAPPADGGSIGGGAAALAGWVAPGCVDALCGARLSIANVSTCYRDTAAERDSLVSTFAALNASADYAQALAAAVAPGDGVAASGAAAEPLASYCDRRYGQLCVDDVIDPACPAIFRSNNYWMVRTSAAAICDLGCLRALCGLQHRRRSFNASTGMACADADLEMLLR